jgi:hypothetical protein
MAERAVEVVAIAAGAAHLRLLGTACDGCAGGCGGRCALFGGDERRELPMPLPAFPIVPGQRLRLVLDDAGLRTAAWRGYGRAWLGLVLGAGAGALAGRAFASHADVLTLAGLASGTFVALAFSKRHLPEPRLQPPAGEPPVIPEPESDHR